MTATSSPSCAVGERGLTWPPSRQRSSPEPWRARPNRSSRASGTPATRPWPTSSRRACASRRPSAGSRSRRRPGSGGRPTWRSRPGSSRNASRPTYATPRPATAGPAADSPPRPASSCGCTGNAWAPKGHRSAGRHPTGSRPVRRGCAPTRPGSDRSAGTTSDASTSACSRGAGSWPPTTWIASSRGATA